MPNNNCANILAELNELLEERENFEWGDGPGGPRNPEWLIWRELGRKIADAQRRLRQCINNNPQNPPSPVPVKISVSGIQCFDQDDGPGFWPFDTEDDEPYVLVFVLNIPRVFLSLNPPALRVNFPQPRVLKVGPWEDVDDDGLIQSAPANTIWDANSGLISTPNEVILISSLVENDNSDPETVRGGLTGVENQMRGHLIANIASAGNRSVFVGNMVRAMTGSVAFSTTPIGSGGVLDADDQIGQAQELRLTQADLDRVFAGQTRRFMLPFRGKGADYRVFFEMSRA